MAKKTIRPCPICSGVGGNQAFPFETLYNGHHFGFYRCQSCSTVYADPVPDDATFEKMYSKSNYHDQYAEGADIDGYSSSVNLIVKYAQPGAALLDYGAGVGHFLLACKAAGFISGGVEYAEDSAKACADLSGCDVVTVERFWASNDQYDIIHLGDVLEHLADPLKTLDQLAGRLKPNGLFFVEGPLQANASPVYWVSSIFARFKRSLRGYLADDAPAHLVFTNATAQHDFFYRLPRHVEMLGYFVSESGWPYAQGGRLKRSIAAAARGLSGLKVGRAVFGNRFQAILRVGGLRGPAHPEMR